MPNSARLFVAPRYAAAFTPSQWWPTMNILDWVLICAGAFWVLRGLMRGAISQIIGVAGILTGFLVASHQYQAVGSFITRQFPSISGTAAGPLSFILLFLLTWFSIAVAGFWVVRVIRSAGLGFLDRLWGAMIGFCKALLFAIVAISCFDVVFLRRQPAARRTVKACAQSQGGLPIPLQIGARKGAGGAFQKAEGDPKAADRPNIDPAGLLLWTRY